MSASENWETFTNASDVEEPDAREAYYTKMRMVKRLTPDDGHDDVKQSESGKRIKAHGHGLGIVGSHKMLGDREGTVEGSEAAWTDDGSIF